MPKRADLEGQVFDRLTVTGEYEHYTDKSGRRVGRWVCICECGATVKATTTNLRRKNTRSCGCLKADNKRKPVEHSFWERVDARGEDECWEWTGTKMPSGYGKLGSRKFSETLAHRWSAVLHGMDTKGKVVRHKCDNPGCVNPGHLETGSQLDNIRDMAERGRSTTVSQVLTEDQVREIIVSDKSAQELADKYGCSVATVRNIKNGITWKQVDASGLKPLADGRKKGEENNNAKLAKSDIPHIRRRLADGESQKEIASSYGVSEHAIHCIKTGKTWKHV